MRDNKMAAAGDNTHKENKTETAGGPVRAAKRHGVLVTNEKKTIQAKYRFTEEEKRDLASKMAQRQLELVEREDEKKAAMAGYTEKIKVLKMEISTSSRKYRDGYEHRDYNCVMVIDYNKREIRYQDIATKKIVDTRPFGPGDDQKRFL